MFDEELFNTGTEISARNPLYWHKLLLNVPSWVRDVFVGRLYFSNLLQDGLKKGGCDVQNNCC